MYPTPLLYFYTWPLLHKTQPYHTFTIHVYSSPRLRCTARYLTSPLTYNASSWLDSSMLFRYNTSPYLDKTQLYFSITVRQHAVPYVSFALFLYLTRPRISKLHNSLTFPSQYIAQFFCKSHHFTDTEQLDAEPIQYFTLLDGSSLFLCKKGEGRSFI